MTTADPPLPDAALAPVMDGFREDRVYLGADHVRNERRTWIVAAICAVTLVAQVGGGLAFSSMALTASGLHMAAHVAVLLVAALSYRLARRYAGDVRFSFGTGKVGYLAGFANAVLLAGTALVIVVESIQRLIAPREIAYDGAMPLALAGLAINVVCMLLLRPTRRPALAHDRDGDLNLSAAHLHLSADVVVSTLAIAGLAAGAKLGWAWADPVAGLAGAALVAQFAWSLIRRTGASLLDMNPSPALAAEVRKRLEDGGSQVLDLHLWRLGPGHHAAIAVVTSNHALAPEAYRARLGNLPGLSHVTIEVRAEGDHAHVH